MNVVGRTSRKAKKWLYMGKNSPSQKRQVL